MVKDKQIKLVIGEINRKNIVHHMQFGYTDGTKVWVIKVKGVALWKDSEITKCIPRSKLFRIGTVNLGDVSNNAHIGKGKFFEYLFKIFPILTYEELRNIKTSNHYFNLAHTLKPYETSIRNIIY